MLNTDDIGIFVTDWDETITSKDTMELLAQAAYTYKPGFVPDWNFFEEHYWHDFTDYTKNYSKPRTNLDEETEYLEGLRRIDINSARLVEKTDLFKAVPEPYIRDQAAKVQFREGWWEILAEMKARGIPVVVISVHWSTTFIAEAFKLRGFDNVEIYCNNIEIGPDNICTGKFVGCHVSADIDPHSPYNEKHKEEGLRSAQDKQEILRKIRMKHPMQPGKKLYYFGDSFTDMLALVSADVGVVVYKDAVVKRLRELGYKIVDHCGPNSSEEKGELNFIDGWLQVRPPPSID